MSGDPLLRPLCQAVLDDGADLEAPAELVRRDRAPLVLEFVIPGDPVGKGRPRFGAGGNVITPKKTRAWERTAALMARAAARRAGWSVERSDTVCIEVDAVKARPKFRPEHVSAEAWATGERVARLAKPDGSNVLKCVEDALQTAGVVVDDAQFWCGQYRSWYAARGEEACVEVEVRHLPGAAAPTAVGCAR